MIHSLIRHFNHITNTQLCIWFEIIHFRQLIAVHAVTWGQTDQGIAAFDFIISHQFWNLDRLTDDQQVMLKLTLPEEAGFYQDLIDHPKVLKVVALSGGYSRGDACAKLKQNPGMIASFSRAFTEGLSKQQSDDEFANTINTSIEEIYEASKV